MNPTEPAARPVNIWLIEDNEPFRRTLAFTISSVEGFRCDQTFTADVAPGPQPLGFTVRTAPATDTAAITILDDDPQPIVSVAGVTVVEGATAAVPLTLGNLNHTCVANYATTEVSATEPEDFAATSGQATLPPSTTIDVVNADREFLGGIIAPGMDAMSEALHLKAAKLPRIDPTRPEGALGNSTAESIRSGVYFGYVAMVEGLITRIRTAAGVSRVIATGGNASLLSDELAGMITVDDNLLLRGLESLTRRE